MIYILIISIIFNFFLIIQVASKYDTIFTITQTFFKSGRCDFCMGHGKLNVLELNAYNDIVQRCCKECANGRKEYYLWEVKKQSEQCDQKTFFSKKKALEECEKRNNEIISI